MTAVEDAPACDHLSRRRPCGALASRAVQAEAHRGLPRRGGGDRAFGLWPRRRTTRLRTSLPTLAWCSCCSTSACTSRSARSNRRRDDMIGLEPLQIILCGAVFGAIGVAARLPLAGGGAGGRVAGAVVHGGRCAHPVEDRKQPSCPMGRSAPCDDGQFPCSGVIGGFADYAALGDIHRRDAILGTIGGGNHFVGSRRGG